MPSAANTRIAKNTIFLYIRMIVTIMVNLYTMRLLWKVLGIDDYGIYNVVGGIVMMFAFLNNAMVAASQRYISFELGRGDIDRLRRTFSISLTVHILIAVAVLLLAETAGLWFLNTKLNLPETRTVAANWVYQCSVISFIFTIISVPYNSCIVAHEHMKVYGYFGILDVVLKLIIVLLVAIIPMDHLIAYSLLILAVSVIMRIAYGIYCAHNFEECHYTRTKDNRLLRDMFSFAGWSFIGNMGFSIRDQGLNIIINIFFNVAVNAAKGIATQVGSVISGFASNFTMALNPQITKRYATGEIDSMLQLVYNGCRYSFLLMSIVVVPLIFSAPLVLSLWLGDVAPYTVGFLQLTLILALIESMVSPITTALQATGKIKKFQLIISLIMLSNLPLAWIWLIHEANPYVVIYISILTSIIALAARLMLLHELVEISYREFLSTVFSRSLPCLLISSAATYFIYQFFDQDFLGLIGFAAISVSTILILIFLIALNFKDRYFIISQIKLRLRG